MICTSFKEDVYSTLMWEVLSSAIIQGGVDWHKVNTNLSFETRRENTCTFEKTGADALLYQQVRYFAWMFSSVFMFPKLLLLWSWNACRKNLLLYETLQHLWKQFNLVYVQCNISPGIIQNSPQKRFSPSLSVGLSLANWDCSSNSPGILPPVTSTSWNMLSTNVIKTKLYLIHMFLECEFFLPRVKFSKKIISIIHFFYSNILTLLPELILF